MPVIGHGVEICTYATRPSNPALGTIIYQTDTDEYLKYVNYGGANRWMQADVKSNRNIVINGGFDVWQRGVSMNAIGGGITTYSSDRWAFGNNNTSSYSVSRSSNVPNNRFTRSARITCTNGANGLNGFMQFVEDLNVYSLRDSYLTMSFWVRGSKTYSNVSYGISTGTTLNQNPGVGNGFTGNVNVSGGTVNITTSWQYVSLSATTLVPSNAAVMGISLPRPTTFSTNDWVEFTGVQVEVGTAPSEFEFEPYETTLRKCQRYYYPIKTSLSNSPVLYRFNYGGYDNVYHCIISLPVSPRITNGISFYDISAGNRIHKPGVRWDNYSSIGAEVLPGNDMNYQINITPSTNDGSGFYGIYLYGVGIIYNGEI